MTTFKVASVDTNESGAEKCSPSADNGSPINKKMVSLDLTTAMGSSLEQDLVEHRTLVGESKESEENIKDTLNNKVMELEMKLRQCSSPKLSRVIIKDVYKRNAFRT